MIKQQWDLRWGDDWGRMRWHCSQTYLQCVCTVYNALHIYTGFAVSIFYYNMQFSRVLAYLIFVIFFTRAKFLENKIYTEKRQFFALNL